MPPTPPPPPDTACPTSTAHAPDQPLRRARYLITGLLLGLGLLLGVFQWQAPWLPGDELDRIVRNPDINPAAADDAPSLGARLRRIFTQPAEGPDQPLPRATYALQWAVFGGSPASFRWGDMLLHAINVLLLWNVLAMLLRSSTGDSPNLHIRTSSVIAILWTVHPALVFTYAADAGRAHLLASLFALLGLYSQLRAHAMHRERWFAASLPALALAMFCYPLPGWVLVAAAIEIAIRGWRNALTSYRVYAVAVLCASSAGVAVWAFQAAKLPGDGGGLFGDPLTRGLLAIGLCTRDALLPLWLARTHLPDPDTGWSHPLVWLGALVLVGSFLHAAWCSRTTAWRPALIGWLWWWGSLIPAIVLAGIRGADVEVRSLYLPLMGLMLVIATVAIRALFLHHPAALPALGLVALFAFAGVGLPLIGNTRSVVLRAELAANAHRDDPRVVEDLAIAYNFAQSHPVSDLDREREPPSSDPEDYYHTRWVETLRYLVDYTDPARYFRTPAELAAFHRRLSAHFESAGEFDDALAQAELGVEWDPGSFRTWQRLAQIHEAREEFDAAAHAYEQTESRLPSDPATRAAHLTAYGLLLLFDLDRDHDACTKLLAAEETGHASAATHMGLALCHIRFGEGATGFAMISDFLEQDPTNVRAAMILAEFHLRSHHWEPAAQVYEAILADYPTFYPALRGFNEVCFQIDAMPRAVAAWADALAHQPDDRAFRSYFAWSLALAGDESADDVAGQLLERDPQNSLATLARMLTELRLGNTAAAVSSCNLAAQGTPIPHAREFERAAAALRVLMERGTVPAEAVLALAAVCDEGDLHGVAREEARSGLTKFLAAAPTGELKRLAQDLQARLSDPSLRPSR